MKEVGNDLSFIFFPGDYPLGWAILIVRNLVMVSEAKVKIVFRCCFYRIYRIWFEKPVGGCLRFCWDCWIWAQDHSFGIAIDDFSINLQEISYCRLERLVHHYHLLVKLILLLVSYAFVFCNWFILILISL
jgi:hypothetical protein